MTKIISRNPATGDILQEIPVTSVDELKTIFERARTAQIYWSTLSPRKRAEHLIQLKEIILNHVDDIVEVISNENGKPQFEAMVNELLPCVDALSYFARKAPKVLKDRKIPLSVVKHRSSYLNYWPVGIVAVISPWNYPFMLPFMDIVMALVAGNAVVFKPSEVTPLVGLKIQELCNEAGLPPHILQTVIGDGSLGAAIIQQKPNKIFFTGSVSTGKKIMAAASEHLIPVNLELGGKDAMIVLPDADLDYATSAALWGGYSNSGQVCASIERVIIHERIADPFLKLLKEKLEKLRQGAPTPFNIDLGAITFEKQKEIYSRHLEEAKNRNAQILTGGDFSSDRRFLKPTLLSGQRIEELEIYKEETFGPTLAVTTFKSIAEAIQKANASSYGLVGSVITQNISLGEQVAKQLEVGTVTINEVVYTAGLAETPWGGVKNSGIGRTHSEMGLYEFVNTRHIHKPRARFLTFKSFWWFPYTRFQHVAFRQFFELYRRSWIDKLKAVPDFLWNFAQFIKKEKRL
jgi:succinate-semialdehyde dehydrogenase/glutarate-semialdehyde dehydrogenase